MKRFQSAALIGLVFALPLAGCGSVMAPPPAAPPPAFTALGMGASYLNGDVIGGQAARSTKMRGAKIGPLARPAAGPYMAELAGELRRQTAGMGIDILQLPGSIVIRIPATLTFNSGSAEIAPQIRATFREVARTLKTRPRTFVDVFAHTDSSGTPAANKALSERRAGAVSAQLAADGVVRARLASRGMGESAPLYQPDDSEDQRAANRRVEIRLVPYTL